MYPGDIPSYSPPSRSFFTPPLPPEYQNPFADKPTLRGTNNEGLISNTVPFNNRRPIPPPSLMPGHERIPFRPPDLAASIGNGDGNSNHNSNDSYFASPMEPKKQLFKTSMEEASDIAGDRKKALNTPARNGNDAGAVESSDATNNNAKNRKTQDVGTSNSKENSNKRQEVLPNIRRILGSNGKKGDIPAVLLRHVTQRPMVSYHQPPASPIVSVDNVETAKGNGNSSSMTDDSGTSSAASPNINKSKQSSEQSDYNNGAAARDSHGNNTSQTAVTTPSAAAAIGEAAATSFTSASATTNIKPTLKSISVAGKSDQGAGVIGVTTREGDAVGAAAAAAASAHTTWTWAWNIHIYLSVVLFTILAVYSLYKLVTYNKLTHLFAQSYFVYIQLILIIICIMRIIYLCVDAYNIHGTFPIFAAELLLNLPSTFLTVAFAVLILFLFLKSLNHKNNRYSALVRPLTVVVGCGVHVGLCITLHYVESYTLQNHHMYYQQQQQHQYFRRQQQQQQQQHQQLLQHSQSPFSGSPSTSLANSPPPRVLSLICQIIYIFICFSLGLLYLYLYRILKRILRSKSQNYIHGYQNLSYAIHITIATALLFVLLAALQIFGAVCISVARPLMSQTNIVEIDWMQWGYQFSLRLIEIAIITLISWVTGLKTSVGSNVNAAISLNSDVRMAGQASGGFGANATGSVIREKHAVAAAAHHNSHSNVANFFLPCTSSSSQEQFETDYPAICNANTNLHTYTMRTGKLIYDDSYALNSLAGPSAASPSGGGTEYQLQEPMYQRPYDTGSIRSAINHNITTEYGPQSTRYHHMHHNQHNHLNMRVHEPASYMSADYMTDATTDHYENPNFDLRKNFTAAVGVVSVGAMQKQSKNTVSSGSASGSGSGSGSSGTSGTSQQQMLLLQSDSCYSEPLQENSSYEFNNFERPVFKEKPIDSSPHPTDECWPEREKEGRKITKSRDRKHNNKLDTTTENPERRSSNSTNSCSSSNGIRYTSYNSYESGGHYNGVRKSGTSNNIDTCSTMLAGQNGCISIASGPGPGPGPGRAVAVMPSIKRVNGAQTLAHTERLHYFQRGGRNMSSINNRTLPLNEFELAPSVCNELTLKQHQMKQQQKPHHHPQHHYNHNNSEEEDEEDEDIISGSNVESTNLISNSEHGYCIASDNSITTSKTPHLHVQNNTIISSIHQHLAHNSLQEHSVACSPDLKANVSTESTDAESQSCISDSMIAADQGFLRFRGGNEEQVELSHGKPTNEDNQPSRSVSLICSSVNGINC